LEQAVGVNGIIGLSSVVEGDHWIFDYSEHDAVFNVRN
jgi:hypothetical protein